MKVRTVCSIVALCLGTEGCVDVLDIPEQPRLVNDPVAAPRQAQVQVPDSELGP